MPCSLNSGGQSKFLLACIVVVHLLITLPTQNGFADETRPNIIYILADDLGYGDLSCYGQTRFSTPNIDQLAKTGMRFTQHYSGSTVCAPSRCCLMTGLHTGHAPVRANSEHKPEGQGAMPADTKTVAHLLQKAGYKTGLFGKWGLGYPGSVSDPLNMGFDRFYGYNCQRMAHCYYPAFVWNDDEREMLWGNVKNHKKDYAPAFIQKKAIEFIRENKDGPFFLYYAAIQPHADMNAPEDYMEKFRGKFLPESTHNHGGYLKQPESHAAFAAMVNVLDDYVGEIMAELKTQGIADNTLVIFSSDNGPHREGGHDPAYWDSNGPMKGIKRDLYEGGIRVPMIASWPGKMQVETISDHVSAFWDFLPTVAELAGVEPETKVDGISMVPTLLGQGNQSQHEFLYWEFPSMRGRIAIRKGDLKAIKYGVLLNRDTPWELYDLSNDVSETRDIASENPETLAEMNSIVKQSHATPENPRFDIFRKKKK